MRHTELVRRMDAALGAEYAAFWAQQTVVAALGGRTPQEALEAGVPPKEVWLAVWEVLELPASQR